MTLFEVGLSSPAFFVQNKRDLMVERELLMRFHEFGDNHNSHIVLIHGGGNSWWNYLRQARLLSVKYHVILPVLDGHGERVPKRSMYPRSNLHRRFWSI